MTVDSSQSPPREEDSPSLGTAVERGWEHWALPLAQSRDLDSDPHPILAGHWSFWNIRNTGKFTTFPCLPEGVLFIQANPPPTAEAGVKKGPYWEFSGGQWLRLCASSAGMWVWFGNSDPTCRVAWPKNKQVNKQDPGSTGRQQGWSVPSAGWAPGTCCPWWKRSWWPPPKGSRR